MNTNTTVTVEMGRVRGRARAGIAVVRKGERLEGYGGTRFRRAVVTIIGDYINDRDWGKEWALGLRASIRTRAGKVARIGRRAGV